MPALTEKQTSSATRAKLANRTRSCIAESDTRQPGLLLLTVRLHPCPPSQTPKPGASHTRRGVARKSSQPARLPSPPHRTPMGETDRSLSGYHIGIRRNLDQEQEHE